MLIHIRILALIEILFVSAAQFPSPRVQDQATPRFRAEVDWVPVDVSVLDDDGNPVLDLEASDFTVLEDGAKQRIVHFSREDFLTVGGEGSAVPGAAAGQSDARIKMLHPPYRRFLIVLGRGTHETFHPIRKLADFVRNELGPRDEVAVTAYDRATDFTTNHDEIADLLDRFDELNPRVARLMALRQSGLEAVYGSRTLPRSLQRDVNDIFSGISMQTHQAGVSPETAPDDRSASSEALMNEMREAQPNRIDDLERQFGRDGATGSAEPSDPQRLEQIEQKLRTAMPFEEFARHRIETDQDLLNIFAGIEYLRYMNGEKHLIYFSSEGLFLSKPDVRDNIARVASDARVRLHTFKTEAIPVKLGPLAQLRREIQRDYAIQTLLEISRDSGGNSCIHRSVDEALETIGNLSSHTYLLAYVPKNRVLDGNFRHIEVKVKRKGVKVLSRSGYFARPRLAPYDRSKVMAYARITAAEGYSDPIDDVPFHLSVSKPHWKGGRNRFRVSVDLPAPTAMAVAGRPGSGHKLVAGVFLLAKDGRVLASSWKNIELNFTAEGLREVKAKGITLNWEEQVGRRIGGEQLKLVLYDVSRDHLGSRVVMMP